ncbi:OLC1v1037092C1 [Oldenlandia corymbosa var. corymbosa]|uniref:OLC1v1037092C1 n=1 Tax=Oldenlandia corymbosa var. corymbosa TaxID=529605 RepID=A0AAV1D0I0_OLDCO|nr:OLC1v1037092C1 [Oldenlandia corymbosa var. corymbosa]
MDAIKPLKKKKWVLPLIFSISISCFIIVFSLFVSNPFQPRSDIKDETPIFVESKLHVAETQPFSRIPRLAYLISGSSGDGQSLRRTLKALYHPLNQYVVHLDLEASPEERMELVNFVKTEALFVQVGNVRVIERSNLVTYRGPTMVSNTLHAAAILLKEDLLHTLSNVSREFNFIEHTSDIGWKEWQRAKPVIIDPGLYSRKKSDVFWVTQKRSVPTAFKLFTGSAWMMLSRPFVEYCIWGWDNLPRMVLMYYSNFLSSPEGYFHTVICNAEEFKNTTVNHDLHFISWDNPPKQHPHFLTSNDYQRMLDSNAPFARKFGKEEGVLEKIDLELLHRKRDGFVPGSWFEDGGDTNSTDFHYTTTNITTLRPGQGAERLKNLINGLLGAKDFDSKHCI